MKKVSVLFGALLPQTLLFAMARRLLKLAGIGRGGIVRKSGEIDAMAAALAMVGGPGNKPVFFDVGANVGQWTEAAIALWPDAELHVFEPSAEHLAILRKTISRRPNITLNDCALGENAGTATLYKNEAVTGLASMTKRDLGHIGVAMDITEQIRVRTLDEYCAERNITSIEYLKIDVEGHELDVLKGASTMLQSSRVGAIQFEFGGCNVDTRTFFHDFYILLVGHGYDIFVIGPGGRLNPIGPYNEFMEQFMTTNYVAVKHAGGRA